MKAFYKKLIETMKLQDSIDQFQIAGIKAIKVVDLYKGQYFNPRLYELYPLPALFVEWAIVHAKNSEEASTAIVGIHICIEQLRDTSSLGKQLDKSLEFFEYIDVVKKILKPLTTDTTGVLKVTDEGVVDDQTIETVYKITYECEYSGTKEYAKDKYVYTDGDGEVDLNGEIAKHIPFD